jgi:hypothetical protein
MRRQDAAATTNLTDDGIVRRQDAVARAAGAKKRMLLGEFDPLPLALDCTMPRKPILLATAVVLLAGTAVAQTREEMVREDRRKVTADGFWIYNDLDQAYAQARETGKPILVVLRCIPCHECVKLDDDLVDKDPVIRPLLEQFVCVRQVSTNGLDLGLFQYDTDQSFAVFMLNADGTIYGRFGTRSHRTEWLGDVSLQGLAEALEGALELHRGYPGNRDELAGKRGPAPEFASPEQFPTLRDKFTDALNYEGEVAKSCIHCHQIGEAQREFYWTSRNTIPEAILFPYPHPKSLGLIMDPNRRARVQAIEPGSVAELAGLLADDRIISIDGQPLLSIADIQWVLHRADPAGAMLPLRVQRGDRSLPLTLALGEGWRQSGDLSWRASSWLLRRMVSGGMVLEALDAEQRRQHGLSEQSMALRVKSVGRFGAHAAAMNAGLKPDDILVGFDGRDDLPSEEALFLYALNHKRPGDQVKLSVLRDRQPMSFQIPIQK